MKETLTRQKLADAVCDELGITKTEAAELVEMVLGEIATALAEGESVKISSFASFLVHGKRARVGRNPKTGTEAEIAPRNVVLFRPSTTLRTRVNFFE